MPIRVIDGHNDVLQRVGGPRHEPGFDFFEGAAGGHLDWPRAEEAGFAGGFFAIFVPNQEEHPERPPEPPYFMPMAEPLESGYARTSALQMLDALEALESKSEGRLRVIRDTATLRGCLADGGIGAIAHVEGAEPIDPELENLEALYARGLRSIGITWSRDNAFGHGVPFAFPSTPDCGPGLTTPGKDLVRACNDLGLVIDLSHLNLAGFKDVARLATKPLVASHSNAHAVCASSRNLTDWQLDAIRDSGGIVGLNFEVSFLRPDGRRDLQTPITDIARHATYIAGRIGIDHLGLGSDFDGCDVPEEISDVRGLPKVLAALSETGFSDSDVQKIGHENWLRVLGGTWR